MKTTRQPCPLADVNTVSAAVLLGRVADYYHERIQKHSTALSYLESRGLNDEALIKKFNIGVADRTLRKHFSSSDKQATAEMSRKLTRLGIYRQSGHEHLNGCIVLPIYNRAGEISQFYGRRMDPKTPRDKRHHYLDQPLCGIFNPEAFDSKEIVIAGSITDALTLYQHGIETVTCTLGKAALTDELLDAIRSTGVENVKLAYPADIGGEQATTEVATKLQSLGIGCHQVKLPWGSDANSYTLAQGGEALKKAVRGAIWIENNSQPVSPLSDDTASGEPQPPEFPELTRDSDYYQLIQGSRTYRIGGLHKNNSLEALKITVRLTAVHEEAPRFHIDTLDLYRDRERRKFIQRASEETRLEPEILKHDLGKLLLALEHAQSERLNEPETVERAVELSEEERDEALDFLQSPDLIERIANAYDEAGIIGEQTNKIAAYLACASRKLNKPLAVIIQSTSAAGKSTLMEAVLSFFPVEEQVKYSAMTGQSLYYLSDLQHKILAIAEEEGAKKASYALKLLQSEGELTIATTGKDPQSGRMETQEYHVRGPVALILTTTSIDIDEELMNRCLVLTVDESREQTERIHKLQREARTIEGILASEKRRNILRVMRNAQRLLSTWRIANPYARHLTFTSGSTRTRRDHEKYLTLIDSIALLHQHQREPLYFTPSGAPAQDTEGGDLIKMLPVTLDDIEAANKIAPEILGRSLDELPPQTRRLLDHIKSHVRGKMKREETGQCTALFTRKELRQSTGWSHTQIRRHLDRLLELEYIAQRGGRNGVLITYELLVDANEEGTGFHIGLIDTAQLRGQ